jgi:tRNA dimethylallyltransferase
MLDAEIISADSRQVYRGCDIGTAKPTMEEREGIPHHGIDIRDAGDDYSAGKYYEDAQRWIADIRRRGKRVLVIGGTGLYIQMIERGIFAAPDVDAALRSRLEQRVVDEGLPTLVEELFALDPGSAAFIDTRNPVRVIRALEVCLLTGEPYSRYREQRMPERRHETVGFLLALDRAVLRERIDMRVDAMIAAGLEREVRSLLDAGVDTGCNAMRSVGYQELIEYFAASISLQHAITLIKQHTWQYARRQMTWFRRRKDLTPVVPLPDARDTAAEIWNSLEQRVR